MQTNRRNFLKESAKVGGAIVAANLLPLDIFASDEKVDKITILHTNDVHSRLESFPLDGSKNAGLGGVAARAELIKTIRAETEQVLLLDAGDIFQGTPYFNLYKGEPEIKAMSIMGYDACTMGNHDFDGGMENFSNQLIHAKFPVILCNYDVTGTPLEGKTIPYKIFTKGNLKIGVLGVGIELKGLVPDNLYGNTIYKNPIESANKTAELLKHKGCDMIICLSHLGDRYFDDKISDEILAKECFDIDLIIGGHTHRLFPEPRKYNNRKGGQTLVNQVGWAGMHVGRLDFSFSKNKKKNLDKVQINTLEEKIMK